MRLDEPTYMSKAHPESNPIQDLSQDTLLQILPRNETRQPILAGVHLDSLLGHGGTGAVYTGESPALGYRVAIKILRSSGDHEKARRYLVEALALAQVSSPNLVRILSAGHECGLHYIILEHVEGSSADKYLADFTKTGSIGLDEGQALKIIAAASSGAVAAHRQGIVHGDIKLENIMIPLDPYGEGYLLSNSKLTDFGTAQLRASQEAYMRPRSPMGTLGVAAPEQLLSSKNVTPASDVFSIGATLYSLLVGQYPFAADTRSKTILRTMQGRATPVHKIRFDVSTATREILEKCLQQDAGRRYQDASELLQALRSLISHDLR